MKTIDLTRILTKDMEHKWVALSRDYKKVVGSAKNLSVLKDQMGEKKVIYMKVPSSLRAPAFLRS